MAHSQRHSRCQGVMLAVPSPQTNAPFFLTTRDRIAQDLQAAIRPPAFRARDDPGSHGPAQATDAIWTIGATRTPASGHAGGDTACNPRALRPAPRSSRLDRFTPNGRTENLPRHQQTEGLTSRVRRPCGAPRLDPRLHVIRRPVSAAEPAPSRGPTLPLHPPRRALPVPQTPILR